MVSTLSCTKCVATSMNHMVRSSGRAFLLLSHQHNNAYSFVTWFDMNLLFSSGDTRHSAMERVVVEYTVVDDREFPMSNPFHSGALNRSRMLEKCRSTIFCGYDSALHWIWCHIVCQWNILNLSHIWWKSDDFLEWHCRDIATITTFRLFKYRPIVIIHLLLTINRLHHCKCIRRAIKQIYRWLNGEMRWLTDEFSLNLRVYDGYECNLSTTYFAIEYWMNNAEVCVIWHHTKPIFDHRSEIYHQ